MLGKTNQKVDGRMWTVQVVSAYTPLAWAEYQGRGKSPRALGCLLFVCFWCEHLTELRVILFINRSSHSMAPTSWASNLIWCSVEGPATWSSAGVRLDLSDGYYEYVHHPHGTSLETQSPLKSHCSGMKWLHCYAFLKIHIWKQQD